MKYAIIGCGRIAPTHISSALENNLEIVGLCDLKLEKAKALAKRYDLSEDLCFSSIDQMLQAVPDLSFVSVATDSGSHHDVVMRLLAKDKNVLCEKPLALGLNDADEMIALAESRGLLLGVCQQNRLNDATQLVKKAIDKGAFGKISNASVCIRWSRDRDYYANDAWRGKWESDGGTLMNQCIHGLDLLRYFCGRDIDSMYAILGNRNHSYLEVEDIGVGVFVFSNGIIATAEGTSNVYKDNLEETITIIGEKGSIKLGGEVAESIKYWKFEDPDVNEWKIAEQSFSSVYGNGHSRIFEDFIECLTSGRKLKVSALDGRDALEMVLAFYESFRKKQIIGFPLPKDSSTLDMAGVNFDLA